jgi:hypothetical protein
VKATEERTVYLATIEALANLAHAQINSVVGSMQAKLQALEAQDARSNGRPARVEEPPLEAGRKQNPL